MTFWTISDGKKLTGSAEDSFNGNGFSPIPDGTIVEAYIKSFELSESEQYGKKYKVRWKIIDGEFKNREISQNIEAFESDREKHDKAINMMMRIYKLCGHSPEHSNPPSNQDLSPMQGKILTIKISLMIKSADQKINFVSEVHESGSVLQKTDDMDSALNRYGRSQHQPVTQLEDLPF